MKSFNVFSLMVVLLSAFFTWNAIADPIKINVMDNLTPEQSVVAHQLLKKKGYQLTSSPLFSESSRAVILTQIIANEVEHAGFQIEMVKMEKGASLPKTVFVNRIDSDQLEEALSKMPKPEELVEEIPSTAVSTQSIAFQSTK